MKFQKHMVPLVYTALTIFFHFGSITNGAFLMKMGFTGEQLFMYGLSGSFYLRHDGARIVYSGFLMPPLSFLLALWLFREVKYNKINPILGKTLALINLLPIITFVLSFVLYKV